MDPIAEKTLFVISLVIGLVLLDFGGMLSIEPTDFGYNPVFGTALSLFGSVVLLFGYIICEKIKTWPNVKHIHHVLMIIGIAYVISIVADILLHGFSKQGEGSRMALYHITTIVIFNFLIYGCLFIWQRGDKQEK